MENEKLSKTRQKEKKIKRTGVDWIENATNTWAKKLGVGPY